MPLLAHLTDLATGVAHDVLPLLVSLEDDVPEDDEVKAGWTAFAVFLLLCAAVAFLGWSLVQQLRKASRARDAGVYGDEPVDDADGQDGRGGQGAGDAGRGRP